MRLLSQTARYDVSMQSGPCSTRASLGFPIVFPFDAAFSTMPDSPRLLQEKRVLAEIQSLQRQREEVGSEEGHTKFFRKGE